MQNWTIYNLLIPSSFYVLLCCCCGLIQFQFRSSLHQTAHFELHSALGLPYRVKRMKVLKWNVKINHQRVFKMMTNINLWILCILILTRCTFLFSFMWNCLIVHCAPLEIRDRRHKLVFPCGMRIIERFKI